MLRQVGTWQHIAWCLKWFSSIIVMMFHIVFHLLHTNYTIPYITFNLFETTPPNICVVWDFFKIVSNLQPFLNKNHNNKALFVEFFMKYPSAYQNSVPIPYKNKNTTVQRSGWSLLVFLTLKFGRTTSTVWSILLAEGSIISMK